MLMAEVILVLGLIGGVLVFLKGWPIKINFSASDLDEVVAIFLFSTLGVTLCAMLGIWCGTHQPPTPITSLSCATHGGVLVPGYFNKDYGYWINTLCKDGYRLNT